MSQAQDQNLSEATRRYIAQVDQYSTHNYHPLPVVLHKGKGEWVWDVDNKKYLDMLSAYSAVNQGHCHPRLVKALTEQAQKITLSSRAFHNDQMGEWSEMLCKLSGKPRSIAMNSGAEAVETAIKLARKWGYLVKKVPANTAEIIVCSDNFHGRTTTIVGFSSDEQYKKDFGPFTPGFKIVRYGDLQALEKAITPSTVAILMEPIQGEAGVIVPPEGFKGSVSQLCKKHNVLLCIDEIQTGLCRTGKMFCFQHDPDCKPNMIILGKALSGGFYPVSAVVGDEEVMSLLKPGDHGSTFGGNPLGCAVSMEALRVLIDEKLDERSARLGEKFRNHLNQVLPKSIVKEVRGKGLLNGIELHPGQKTGRHYSIKLMEQGILAKDTHNVVVRFAPPLVMEDSSLDWALTVIEKVFKG